MEKIQTKDVLISEMDIPKPLGETIFIVAIFVIVVFFVLLAILNILFLHYIPKGPLIASIIWLVFIFFSIRSSCREDGGVRQFMIKLVGVFAPHQFAQIVRQNTGRKVLCFGYQLFRNRFCYIKIQCDGIKTIDWSPGQGSRGTNDWHISVWFDKDSATTLNWASSHKPRFGIYVGPSLNKQKTEELGNRFIEFLRNDDVNAAKCDENILQGLIGASGISTCGLLPVGKVRLGEYEYYAHSAKGLIDKDIKVRVVEKRGVLLPIKQVKS